MRKGNHGGDWATYQAKHDALPRLDFSANVSPLGPPEGVKQAMREAIEHVAQYPDPRCCALRKALGEHHGVDPAHILCGNGAADLIDRLALALRPKRALVTAPTFSEYAEALERVGGQVISFPLREEHPSNAELEKKLLPRSILYSGSAAVVYLAAYPILNRLFGVSLLVLGIYLPMLVVEPLLTYRFGRVQESPRKALSKGVRITVGYSLLLLLLGCVREWLSAGTVFGHLLSRPILPMAGMPAGGFIVLGVLCAVWRTLAKKQKDYLTSEARGLMAVYRQREGEPQDEQ